MTSSTAKQRGAGSVTVHTERTATDWRTDAACRRVDPELFFPDPSDLLPEALAVCAVCPVRKRCAQVALANSERFGVWGGLTEAQRRPAMRRAARRQRTGVSPGLGA